MKNSKKGFTLMEMLIVIAIIAILIAIAIPVFTAQLNKAKKGTDQSNARSLKSMVVTKYLTEGKTAVPDNQVFYLNKAANAILTTTTDALKCEGSGDGYAESSSGKGDAGYVWAKWGTESNPAVVDTNPSLVGAAS